jgi:hypothetical protein
MIKKRDTILVLLALALLPAYYLVSHRSVANKGSDLRDALSDNLTDANRAGPAVNKKEQVEEQTEEMPGLADGNGFREEALNNAADNAPETLNGNGAQQPPSFENPGGNAPQYTPETSVMVTREVRESREVSPSAP